MNEKLCYLCSSFLLKKDFFNALTCLSNALEQKDEYTKNHSEIVSVLCEKLCIELKQPYKFTENVVLAAKLHDMGKIGIKDAILLKTDSLTKEEYDIIKKHPEMSYDIIKPIDYEGSICNYILHHHERWDGKGYPHKLRGEQIPLGSRIIAVTDTFNALVSTRPYREAKTEEYALKILLEGKGTQFDSEIVDAFFKISYL